MSKYPCGNGLTYNWKSKIEQNKTEKKKLEKYTSRLRLPVCMCI